MRWFFTDVHNIRQNCTPVKKKIQHTVLLSEITYNI
jgi:hypothetical protein